MKSMIRRISWSMIALLTVNLVHAGDNYVSKTNDVILVHGAWADGSSWDKIIPLLQGATLADRICTTRGMRRRLRSREPCSERGMESGLPMAHRMHLQRTADKTVAGVDKSPYQIY